MCEHELKVWFYSDFTPSLLGILHSLRILLFHCVSVDFSWCWKIFWFCVIHSIDLAAVLLWWFFAPGGTPMELVRVECEHIALTRLNCTASRLIWTFINPVFAFRWILQCCQHILCSQAYVFNAVSVDGYRLRWNLRCSSHFMAAFELWLSVCKIWFGSAKHQISLKFG